MHSQLTRFFYFRIASVLAFQIAARVREFAKSDDKELVFPSGLSAGERNAAHSLAAAEGLGHESKGDEGNRALHLWKVRIQSYYYHSKYRFFFFF